MLPTATGLSIAGIPTWSKSNPIKLGVTYGNQGWAMADVAAFDAWCGRKTSLITIFTTLDNANLATQIKNVKAVGKIPLVTVEPWLGLDQATNNHPIAGHMARIVNGEFDAQIKTVAALLAGCWVRFGHEPNGNWYPWAQSPKDYIAAWKRFVGFLPASAKRVWCVNNGDWAPGAPAEQFFPGPDVVDFLALDGYNWDTKSPAQVFGPMLDRVQALASLPICITEAGSVEYTGKVKFVDDLVIYAIAKKLFAVSYFNQYGWSIFGGVNGDSIFQGKYKNYLACATSIFRLDPA
jgi:mannan endo-1,4-beta-mannosidase